MMKELKEAIINRRSIYTIDDKIKVSDNEIREIIDTAVLHVPSAFNSQSSRVVLLLDDHHKKVWNITKNTLKKIVAPEEFKTTEKKIDTCFASGYGTILYFEDMDVIERLQKTYPYYKNNFPVWAEQGSAMLQFAIWTMLEAAGLGATLQHYNPLIDEEVAKTWELPAKWKLIAQMPFGNPLQKAAAKDFKPLDERFKVFK